MKRKLLLYLCLILIIIFVLSKGYAIFVQSLTGKASQEGFEVSIYVYNPNWETGYGGTSGGGGGGGGAAPSEEQKEIRISPKNETIKNETKAPSPENKTEEIKNETNITKEKIESCEEWGECKFYYGLPGEKTGLGGWWQICKTDFSIYKPCKEKQPVLIKKLKENPLGISSKSKYFEIVDEKTNKTLFAFEITPDEKLNIKVKLEKGKGYPPHCFDGKKNYGEDGIDCIKPETLKEKGPLCPICCELNYK